MLWLNWESIGSNRDPTESNRESSGTKLHLPRYQQGIRSDIFHVTILLASYIHKRINTFYAYIHTYIHTMCIYRVCPAFQYLCHHVQTLMFILFWCKYLINSSRSLRYSYTESTQYWRQSQISWYLWLVKTDSAAAEDERYQNNK